MVNQDIILNDISFGMNLNLSYSLLYFLIYDVYRRVSTGNTLASEGVEQEWRMVAQNTRVRGHV